MSGEAQMLDLIRAEWRRIYGDDGARKLEELVPEIEADLAQQPAVVISYLANLQGARGASQTPAI